MKDRNWFEQNGWYWDKRDHMWKRKVDGLPTKAFLRFANEVIEEMKGEISKPFTKVDHTLIFDNCQYPLKFHEVMFKT